MTQYEKILYIGADTLVFQDLTIAFCWQAPAAAYYLTDYSIKDNGILFNPDFMLIEPDLNKYVELIEITTKYLKNPAKDEKELGRDDMAVLNLLYRGEISVFPIQMMHENGGYKHTVLGNPRDINFHVIYSAGCHFAGKGKPWLRWSIYTEIWKCFALVFYEKLDLPFRLRGVAMNYDKVYKLFFHDYIKEGIRYVTLEEKIEDTDPDDDIYPEIAHSGARRVMTMNCLVTFISSLALKFIIRSHEPIQVFVKNWQQKINQFISLDEAPNMPSLIENDIDNYNKDHKSKKKRKTKKKKQKSNNVRNNDNLE